MLYGVEFLPVGKIDASLYQTSCRFAIYYNVMKTELLIQVFSKCTHVTLNVSVLIEMHDVPKLIQKLNFVVDRYN